MKLLLLLIYSIITILRFGLDWLNLNHRQKEQQPLPDVFDGQIDEQRLKRSDAYALAGDKVGFVEDIVGVCLTFAFLFGGILPWYDNLIDRMSDHFVVSGLLFFALLFLIQGVISLPFSLYRNFVLEERFGFNRMSFKLWISDLLKSLAVGGLLFVILLVGPCG